MPELDTLRGVAVFGVLVVHGFVFSYGYTDFTGPARVFMHATSLGKLGVNLFFVLSGFLITGILLNSKSSPTYFKTFYTRRALRILPAYAAMMVLLFIGGISLPFIALSSIFLANLTPAFGVAMSYGPLWSLAVEEHFYLLWPAVVRRISSKSIAIVAALLCISVPILRYFCFGSASPFALGNVTWFNCDGLALGALVQLLCRQRYSRRSLVWLATFVAIGTTGALFLLARMGIADQSHIVGATIQLSLFNLLFAAVLLSFLLIGSGPNARIVNIAPLRFLGYLSYGLYLVHLFVFIKVGAWLTRVELMTKIDVPTIALRFVLLSAISISLAYVSRKYFEDWFLRRKDLTGSTHENLVSPPQRIQVATGSD